MKQNASYFSKFLCSEHYTPLPRSTHIQRRQQGSTMLSVSSGVRVGNMFATAWRRTSMRSLTRVIKRKGSPLRIGRRGNSEPAQVTLHIVKLQRSGRECQGLLFSSMVAFEFCGRDTQVGYCKVGFMQCLNECGEEQPGNGTIACTFKNCPE